MIRDVYGGQVPDDFDELLKLPGVGRKSANLIVGDVFGKPAIVTDTHCIRLVNRIGLVDGIKEPKKVEMELWKLIPPKEGSDFCHRLVYHGREVCTARTTPHCERCCLSDICASANTENNEKSREKNEKWLSDPKETSVCARVVLCPDHRRKSCLLYTSSDLTSYIDAVRSRGRSR